MVLHLSAVSVAPSFANNIFRAIEVASISHLIVHQAQSKRLVDENNFIKLNTAVQAEETYSRIKYGLLILDLFFYKSLLVHDLIADHHIGLFCLTKTWLQEEEDISLNESTPPIHLNYP